MFAANMTLKGSNRDRWLLSYADFVTLLFAVFVLMYATAKAKEQRVVTPGRTGSAAGVAISPVRGAASATMPVESNLLTDLRKTLKVEQQDGLVTLSTEPRGIVIALDDKMCFGAGRAEVDAAAVTMFAKVADVLARYDNRILLEGHTDSVPIHNSQFRSNWELSTARSMAVMELMERSAALRQERFLIGGSADNAPVSDNGTEQGRAHNRRVEIIVLDSPASMREHPVAFAGKGFNE